MLDVPSSSSGIFLNIFLNREKAIHHTYELSMIMTLAKNVEGERYVFRSYTYIANDCLFFQQFRGASRKK